MARDIRTALVVLILIFAASEGALRLFLPGNYLQFGFDVQREESLKKRPTFFRDHFCDFIHQTAKGEQLTARYIMDSIHDSLAETNESHDQIWTAGASTTHGFNCGSETSWPLEISKQFPKIEVRNLATDAAIAQESIEKMTTLLSAGQKPKMVLWAHGMSELGFYGDQRDSGWNVLQKNSQLTEGIRRQPFLDNLIILFLRIDISIQRYSYAYKYLRENVAKLTLSRIDGYHQLIANSSESDDEWTVREDYIFSHGVFGGPVRNLLSEEAQAYALKKYELNLRKMIEIARSNNFELVCIHMPSVVGFYSFLSQSFGRKYDSWAEKVNALTESVAKEFGIKVIDIQSEYLKEAQKSG